MDWISDAADVVTILGFPSAAVALVLAFRQTRDAADSARQTKESTQAQFILTLDLVLAQSEFEDLRRKLAQGPVQLSADEQITLRRYVAALERLGLLVKKKQVSLGQADAFYGSRLRKLVTNGERYVRNLVDENPAWEDFRYLWREMDSRWEPSTNPPKG